MSLPILSNRTYFFLFSLLGIVYIAGLFVPLMDNDAAHHAAVALHMYLTGDYVSLVDAGGDYLDKPHFLFWASALSYHVFGVTTFAYKFPSFLFTILGIYSIYRLGKELYNLEIGKLASLIAASSFCYLLANNDVRMDAILAAAVAFSMWQLIAFVHHKKKIFLIGAALGLAIGFSTKGHVGFVTPVIGLVFYIFFRKEWKLLYDPRWLITIAFFFLFISPVVYCYYLQYDLHPEKITKGMKGVSGVRYILLDHSFQRILGDKRFGPGAGKEDHFFFLHTFLWTFAPWCIIAFVEFFLRLKKFFSRKEEWFSTGIFLILALLINFSNFKLPHYMPIVVPAAALFTADFFVTRQQIAGWKNFSVRVLFFSSILLLLLAGVVNIWAFPLKNTWVLIITMLLLSVVFYFWISKINQPLHKAIASSVSTMACLFFLLNTNFYPQLLAYQAGKPLADISKESIDAKNVFFWKGAISSSYNFYTATNRQVYTDSISTTKKIWIIYNASQLQELEAAGLRVVPVFSVPDYKITRMNAKFINPQTRKETLSELVLAEIIERKK